MAKSKQNKKNKKYVKNPLTGRMILRNGPTYCRLREERKHEQRISHRARHHYNSNANRRTALSVRAIVPKGVEARRRMYYQCGPKCFGARVERTKTGKLLLKYPLCAKGTCRIDPRLVLAAAGEEIPKARTATDPRP